MKDIEIQDYLEKLIAKVGMKQVVKSLIEICYNKSIKSATVDHDMAKAKEWIKYAVALEVINDLAYHNHRG